MREKSKRREYRKKGRKYRVRGKGKREKEEQGRRSWTRDRIEGEAGWVGSEARERDGATRVGGEG